MKHSKQIIPLSILFLLVLSACGNLSGFNPTETMEPQTVIVFQEGEPGESCPTPAACPTCETCQTQIVCPTCEASVEVTEEVVVVETQETESKQLTPTPEFWQPENFSGDYAYSVLGMPSYLRNYAHLDLGCSWQGVAGQVLDKYGSPVESLVVLVEGTLNGEEIELIALSGMAPAYGPGGYEITLSNTVVESTGDLKISLFDIEGNLLYEPFDFETYADCQRNLMVVNYQEQ